MKNLIVLLFVSLCLFTSCQKKVAEENFSVEMCDTATPLTDLPWLNKIVSDNGNCTLFKGAKIYSYSYEGKRVFFLQNPSFSRTVTCIFVLYDCLGNNISPTTTSEWEKFEQNRKEETLLWEKK
jgi:hypothetical protein